MSLWKVNYVVSCHRIPRFRLRPVLCTTGYPLLPKSSVHKCRYQVIRRSCLARHMPLSFHATENIVDVTGRDNWGVSVWCGESELGKIIECRKASSGYNQQNRGSHDSGSRWAWYATFSCKLWLEASSVAFTFCLYYTTIKNQVIFTVLSNSCHAFTRF